MAEHISIEPAQGTWVARAGGREIVRSSRALKLTEGGYPPVIYFPRDDADMALLTRTERQTTCSWKGQASYYSVRDGERLLENAVWSYEAPLADMQEIAGHLAFYADRVTVEAA
jgi:uncharacterized protein (DUF427 family)